MRIVLFAYSHIEYTLELAESLSKLEDVLLLIPKAQARRFQKVIKSRQMLVPFHQPRLRYPTNIFMIAYVLMRIVRFRPDVIHLQGEHPWFDLVLPLLSKIFPVVVTVHDVILHSGDKSSTKIPSFIYKINRKNARKVIVHGQQLKKEMLDIFRKKPVDIYVLPRGVNSIYQRFETDNVPEEGQMILFFGRIWPYKGLKYLIEAEPLISEKCPNVKIVIAGTGENLDKYKSLAGNSKRFIWFEDFIPNQKVAVLFQKASIVVLPYTDASQSGVVPLAYAFGKPVVVTNVGALPEVVKQGDTGYIVPPRNSEALATAIVDLLLDKQKRKQMGRTALHMAETDLSWDQIARNTIEVYKAAILTKPRFGLLKSR